MLGHVVKILSVCTGNVCRSPFAEQFLQAELRLVSPQQFLVSSAGTHALVGHGIDQGSALLLTESGFEATAFAARQVSSELLEESDLILTMTREQRAWLLRQSPRILKRVFTVREFARALNYVVKHAGASVPRGADPATVSYRWAEICRQASFYRSDGGDLDDVVDPYRSSEEVYIQMYDELVPALDIIVAFEEWASNTAV